MRESTTELGLVTVTLTASCVVILILLATLTVRLLIIQNLNILIIIIIISFLALRLESSHRHPRQPAVLPIICIRAWPRRSINIIVRARSLTCRQVASWTQCR